MKFTFLFVCFCGWFRSSQFFKYVLRRARSLGKWSCRAEVENPAQERSQMHL